MNRCRAPLPFHINYSPPAPLTSTISVTERQLKHKNAEKPVTSPFGAFLEQWFNVNSKVLLTNLNNLPSWCCKRKQFRNGSLGDHSKPSQTRKGVWKCTCPSPLTTCSIPLNIHPVSLPQTDNLSYFIVALTELDATRLQMFTGYFKFHFYCKIASVSLHH